MYTFLQPIFCHAAAEGKWLYNNVCSRFAPVLTAYSIQYFVITVANAKPANLLCKSQ